MRVRRACTSFLRLSSNRDTATRTRAAATLHRLHHEVGSSEAIHDLSSGGGGGVGENTVLGHSFRCPEEKKDGVGPMAPFRVGKVASQTVSAAREWRHLQGTLQVVYNWFGSNLLMQNSATGIVKQLLSNPTRSST